MTQDEQRMLTDLANKIAQTPAPPRDPEAEAFIRSHIGNRADALYLMTQTVLIQNMAIQQAQNQIRDLQQRPPQPAFGGSGGSFLGGQSMAAPPQQSYAPAPSYAPVPPAGAPMQSGGPSFLRGAAQTAAGVAAGALAFEGIRSLFSHPGYGMGSGFGGSGLMGGSPVEETVVNNYYDSPERESRHANQLADSSDTRDDDDTQDDSQTDDSNLSDASDTDYQDSNGSDDSTDIA